MRSSHPKSRNPGRRGDHASRGWIAVFCMAWVLALAGPVSADHYEPKEAGHPIRIIAYALHPIGVAIDYLIMRPAHWLGSHEPLKTIFGHED